ncbi:MAG: hypothetical protein AB7P02_14865 [Alphaproteobacteria bacterium]
MVTYVRNNQTREMTAEETAAYLAIQPTAAEKLAAARARALVAVRAEAERRILLIAPAHRQRNLTARAAEIALFEAKPWSAEVAAEVAAGLAIWAAINAIRGASDIGELAVLAAETAEAAAAVPAAVAWPE